MLCLSARVSNRWTFAQEIEMKHTCHAWTVRLLGFLRSVGPYAAIELVLPGGSVIALVLWLYRHRTNHGHTHAS
jgi:hypothetical protein